MALGNYLNLEKDKLDKQNTYYKFTHESIDLSFSCGQVREILSKFCCFLEACGWPKYAIIDAMQHYINNNTELTKKRK